MVFERPALPSARTCNCAAFRSTLSFFPLKRTLLQKQLADLRIKYNEFKQPVLLGQRMERIKHELTEVEIAVDDLTGIEVKRLVVMGLI
jgi:hypothetical protein